MKFRLIHLSLLACMGLILGCSSSDKITNNVIEESGIDITDYSFVQFDLASGDPGALPLPNEVLRNPATGNLALPSFGDPAIDALVAQVNTLNGFSTSAFIRIPFVGGVNEATVGNASILVLDTFALATDPANAQVLLNWTVEHDDDGNALVRGYPIKPMAPGHTHLVIITPGVVNDNGLPVESDSAMLALKGKASLAGGPAAALEPLRQLYDASVWPTVEAVTGLDRLFVPAAWVFTTQTLHDGLAGMYANAQSMETTPDIITAAIGTEAVDSVFNLLGFGAVPHESLGALTFGTFQAPNYISDPVNGYIQSLDNPSMETIDFLATLPAGPSPFGDGTYPVIIYQHGITSNKETMVALANSAASVGYATIAIDMVLHGSRSIDANGDGQIDSSGESFINLVNLLLSRDNIRQSVSDLFSLSSMITSGHGDMTGDGVADLNPAAISFVGISLGSMVGTDFVTVDPAVRGAVINVGGGRISTLLQQSQTFSGPINAGLAQFGLVPGTALYDIYWMFAQAIIDDADPFNYAPYTTNGNLSAGVPTAVLHQEMIGDGVVGNNGTRDLATAFGIPQIDAVQAVSTLAQENAPHFGSGFFQFETPADVFTAHGALLDPSGGNPTAAVQVQALTFLGTALQGTPTIINPYGKQKMMDVDIFRGIDDAGLVGPLNLFPNK